MRWLLPLALAACASHAPSTATKVLSVDDKVDVVFVIDDSISMSQTQQRFATSLPAFINVLGSRFGTQPDVHVGFLATTVGLGPGADVGPDCPSVTPGGDGRLAVASLADVSAGQVAELGTSGCGFEEPLEAMKRAGRLATRERRLHPRRRVPRGDDRDEPGRLLE